MTAEVWASDVKVKGLWGRVRGSSIGFEGLNNDGERSLRSELCRGSGVVRKRRLFG